MKRLFIFLVTSLLVCMLTPGAGRPERAEKKLRFALVPKVLSAPVFEYAHIGAEREAARLGNVEVIWEGPETIVDTMPITIYCSMFVVKYYSFVFATYIMCG